MKKKIVLGLVVLTMSMAGLVACGQAKDELEVDNALVKQEETATVAGTYSHTYTEEMEGNETEITETVVLKDDNTCEVTFQDTVAGTYTEDKITLDDGSSFEYNVEGDTLNLNRDGEWVSFSK